MALLFSRVIHVERRARAGSGLPRRARTHMRPDAPSADRGAASRIRPELHPAVLGDRPVRVVGDLPGMAVGVEEDGAVAAPERLGWLAPDPRSGSPGLRRDLVDLLAGADVDGEGDAAPSGAVLDAAVLGQPLAVPERNDPLAGLEEDDVVLGGGVGCPAERLVELPRPRQVGDSERNQVDPLLHRPNAPTSGLSATGCEPAGRSRGRAGSRRRPRTLPPARRRTRPEP